MQQEQQQGQSFFLIGEWTGEGKLEDSQKQIQYSEQISITHVKGPVHMYIQKTKKLPEQTPLHSEMGYIRVFPVEGQNKGKIEFCLAQPFGVCEIETGTFDEKNIIIQTQEQSQIIRTGTAKSPQTTEVKRHFWINEDGNLQYQLHLGTSQYAARLHLSAVLKKSQ